MSRPVQTLIMSASMLALAVTARPISDPTLLNQMGIQAQEAFSQTRQASLSLFSQLSSTYNSDTSALHDESSESLNEPVSSAQRAIQRLVDLAGQAPMELLEKWASGNTHPVEDMPAVVHHSTSDETGEMTIFVFSSPASEDETVSPGQSSLNVAHSPDSVSLPEEPLPNKTDVSLSVPVPESDSVESSAGDEEDSDRTREFDLVPPSTHPNIVPLVASAGLALVSLGVVASIFVILRTLRTDSTSAPGDEEQGDKFLTAPSTPRPTEKKELDPVAEQLNESTEKLLIVIDSSQLRAASPLPCEPSSLLPHMIPLPEVTDDEKLAFLSTPRYIAHDLPDISEAVPALQQAVQLVRERVSVQSWRPSQEPILPMQVALLFPWLDDGWMLQFFLVLFGWWSVLLSGRNHSHY